MKNLLNQKQNNKLFKKSFKNSGKIFDLLYILEDIVLKYQNKLNENTIQFNNYSFEFKQKENRDLSGNLEITYFFEDDDREYILMRIYLINDSYSKILKINNKKITSIKSLQKQITLSFINFKNTFYDYMNTD